MSLLRHMLLLASALPTGPISRLGALAQGQPGVLSFVAPAGFPSAVFPSYHVPPTPTQEPQPAVFDPVLNSTYPSNLTDPKAIPTGLGDPPYYPPGTGQVSNASAGAFVDGALAQIREIIAGGSGISGNCSKCIAALKVGKMVAQAVPERLPAAMIALCQSTGFASHSSCATSYAPGVYGATWTQVLAYADVGGQDGLYICNSLSSKFCPRPTANELDTTGLFPKPRPVNASAPEGSGRTVKVLHMSDMHLDPRYYAGSEANCSSGLCCRTNAKDAASVNGSISLPAPLYGAFKCDSPYDLVTASLQAVEPLTGTTYDDPLAWTIYTGDLVAHDPASQISRAYVDYAEASVFQMMKYYLKGPVFAALGNHDTAPVAIDSPHSLPGPLDQQYSWNYDHVASLWQAEGWISNDTASQARLHYGAYAVTNQHGLRVITLNTDFWYKSNFLNFINTTDPDVSGILAFLISELQEAEDRKQAVWIIGHVLSGWDGGNSLPNPTNLFYQIVERYSPHVIRACFFGHTHEDFNYIFYANNGSVQDAAHALVPAWVGPSVTPLTNLNSGFRMYEVDTGSFDVREAYTFYADVATFPPADGDGSAEGPTFRFEYSTRDAYGIDWPADAPLNATYWHLITEAMAGNQTMAEMQNTFMSKSSVRSPTCTTAACREARVCYMRSGSEPLGRRCPKGFGSVQGK